MGNRTRITHPDGYYVNEGRTYSGELLNLTDSTGAVLATYNYDSLGRRVSLVHGNGNTVTYGYDPATNRLSSYQDDFVGTAFDSTVNLTYNPAGQIQSRTQSNDAAYTWASSGADKTQGLGYDRGNRLTSASSSIITFNDVRGNLQGFVSPNVMGNNNRYLYDVESRLSSVTSASKPFGSLKYDPSGMLSNVTTSQSSTDYLYDGDDLIAKYQSGAVLRRYIHGDGPDEPVASYEGAGLSTRYYLHADERGSVVAVSDATGAAVATSKYSVDGASARLASEFGFTGQLWLPSVQLYYYKARMYSPQLGRFMQRDQLGYAAGLNLYAYAGGDPVNRVDPSGLIDVCAQRGFALAGTYDNVTGLPLLPEQWKPYYECHELQIVNTSGSGTQRPDGQSGSPDQGGGGQGSAQRRTRFKPGSCSSNGSLAGRVADWAGGASDVASGIAIVSGGLALASSETIVGGLTFGAVAGASGIISLGASGVQAGAQYLDRNYGGLQQTVSALVFSVGLNKSFGLVVAKSIGSVASKAGDKFGVGIGIEVGSQALQNICEYYVPNE